MINKIRVENIHMIKQASDESDQLKKCFSQQTNKYISRTFWSL
jgi:hypothetical protein